VTGSAPAVAGVGTIAIDAVDPARAGTFWADLIGGTITIDDDGDALVRAPGYPGLDFLRVPDVKSVKNRLHLDLDVTDLTAATQQALALGATVADDVHDGSEWQVLRDPEGNEFCLIPPGVT